MSADIPVAGGNIQFNGCHTGTILAAVWVLMQALEGGWLARAIALLATSALLVTRLNPILLPSCWAGLFVALHGLAPA